MTIDEYYKEENMIGQDVVVSPTGRFELVNQKYRIKDKEGYLVKRVIRRVSDGKTVAEVKSRTGFSTPSEWFMKDGNEWYLTGQSYMTQTFINCEKGLIYDNYDELKRKADEKGWSINEFCWSSMHFSPDMRTLAVCGCIWGGPYEIIFYDISDISKGWIMMKAPFMECIPDPAEYGWNSDGSFTFCTSELFTQYKGNLIWLYDKEYDDIPDEYADNEENDVEIPVRVLTVRREGDEMVVVKDWKNDDPLVA